MTPVTLKFPLAASQVEPPPRTRGVVKVCRLVELFVTLPPAVSVKLPEVRPMLKMPAPELNVMLPSVTAEAMLGLKRPAGAVPKNTAVLARLAGAVPPQFVAV